MISCIQLLEVFEISWCSVIDFGCNIDQAAIHGRTLPYLEEQFLHCLSFITQIDLPYTITVQSFVSSLVNHVIILSPLSLACHLINQNVKQSQALQKCVLCAPAIFSLACSRTCVCKRKRLYWKKGPIMHLLTFFSSFKYIPIILCIWCCFVYLQLNADQCSYYLPKRFLSFDLVLLIWFCLNSVWYEHWKHKMGSFVALHAFKPVLWVA
jgi:hypothetical protein